MAQIWWRLVELPPGPSSAGGPVVPGHPHLKLVTPRLPHTSNIVFKKCGPPFLFLSPPAATSWRWAWLPHDSSSLKGSIYLVIRGKKEWQNSLRLGFQNLGGKKKTSSKKKTILPFWPLFCRWFGYYFASVRKMDTTSLHVNVAASFAQILKIFDQIMVNFSALGMQPHPLHPHVVRLWLVHMGIQTN